MSMRRVTVATVGTLLAAGQPVFDQPEVTGLLKAASTCKECVEQGSIYALRIPFGSSWYAAECASTCQNTINYDINNAPFSVTECINNQAKCDSLSDRFGSTTAGQIGGSIGYNATGSAYKCYTEAASFHCPTCQSQSNCVMLTSLTSKQEVVCVERAISLDPKLYGAAPADCRPDAQGICEACVKTNVAREVLNLMKGTAHIDCVASTACAAQFADDLSIYTRCLKTKEDCAKVTPQKGGGLIDSAASTTGSVCFKNEGIEGCEQCVGAAKDCNYYLTKNGEGGCLPKDAGYPIQSPAITDAAKCPSECSKCPQGFKYHMSLAFGLGVTNGRCELNCQTVSGVNALIDYCVENAYCDSFKSEYHTSMAVGKTDLPPESCWYPGRQNSCHACATSPSSEECAWYGTFCAPLSAGTAESLTPVKCDTEAADAGTKCAKCPGSFQILFRGDKRTAMASCVPACLGDNVAMTELGLELAYQYCIPTTKCSSLPQDLKDVISSAVDPTAAMGELPVADTECWGKDCSSCTASSDTCTYLTATKNSGVSIMRGCVPTVYWNAHEQSLMPFYTPLIPGQSCAIDGALGPFGSIYFTVTAFLVATAVLI